MTDITWPPMPEPFRYPEGDVLANCACGSWPGGKCLRCPPQNFYTAEQVEDARRACALAALEAAIRVCEQTGIAMSESYGEGAECIRTGDECADQLRKLKDTL